MCVTESPGVAGYPDTIHSHRGPGMNIEAISGSATVAIACTFVFLLAAKFWHLFARSLNAHPNFIAIWADGHGRQPSESHLFFADESGNVFRLPETMSGETAHPEQIR